MDKKEGAIGHGALSRLLIRLSKTYDVFAPIEEEGLDQSIVRFEAVGKDNVKRLNLRTKPSFSAKKLFLPQRQPMLSMRAGNGGFSHKFAEPLKKPQLVFGIRACDLIGTQRLDRVFLEEPEDPYYRRVRENTAIVGIICHESDDYCFCDSVITDEIAEFDAGKGCDALLRASGSGFFVKLITDRGVALFRGAMLKASAMPLTRREPCRRMINPTRMEEIFDSAAWDEDAKLCLGCGKCTLICPSCGCYTVEDESLLRALGERVRHWDSCQLASFTRVAGGHSFRDKREGMLKHRAYHKFVYFKKRFGKTMCVGCGRCTKICPTGIDMVKVINRGL